MNLDELQSTQHRERRTDSLQQLRDSFYRDVGEYIAELKAERDRAADEADDPFSDPEVQRLTDEIESAKEVVEAIYERRMGKLVKHASLVAAGMDADEEGMTDEERELFADIVDRIERNKSTVLDVLEGEDVDVGAPDPDPTDDDGMSAAAVMGGDAGAAGDDPAPPEGSDAGGATRNGADAGVDPAPADREAADDGEPGASADGEPNAAEATDAGGRAPSSERRSGDDEGGERPAGEAEAVTDGSGAAAGGTASDAGPDAGGAGADGERLTVRITDDVGEILGVDERSYDLREEDVVALPKQNAEPLVERDAAEHLD